MPPTIPRHCRKIGLFLRFMKKTLLLFTLLFLSSLRGQFFTGEILIRDQSVYYLNQVYVTNLSAFNTVSTDYFGTFKIAAKVGDVIRFTSIVTDRKDVTVSADMLQNSRNIVELKVAYYDIQEVVISKFKPTGNLRKDVSSLKNGEKNLALQKMIGLPTAKGDGTPPVLPVAALSGGGVAFSLEAIYDILSGERKKKERAFQYERMTQTVTALRQYYGDAYFTALKIPAHLIDNFLQFVYTSENLYPLVEANKLDAAAVYIEKYRPVYERRLKNSHLMDIQK